VWLTVLPAFIALIYSYWDIVDHQLLRFEWYAVQKILAQKVEVTAQGPKVERKALNSSLAPLISTSSGQYYIIVGPRGCGKSTAVTQACVGKEGVARITVKTVDANVLEKVAKKFGVASSYYNFDEHDDLVKLFKAASNEMKIKGKNGWLPTIICEIDRGAGADTVAAVAKALKVAI
jgi:hypothetical protein